MPGMWSCIATWQVTKAPPDSWLCETQMTMLNQSVPNRRQCKSEATAMDNRRRPETLFRRIAFVVAAAIVVCASCDSASAQRRSRKPKVVELKRFNIEGSVVGVRQGWIQCVDADGNRRTIRLDKELTQRVVVTGTAEPQYVQPGMYVRFTAPLDRRGRPPEPINELTLISPREGIVPGVFLDDPTDPEGPYLVIGQIRSIKRGKVTLAAANRKVEFEVTETPQIKVDFSDYSLARQGDAIKVHAVGQNPQELFARVVEIELSQPLGFSGDSKKRGRSSRTPRRSSRRGGETAHEEGEPRS